MITLRDGFGRVAWCDCCGTPTMVGTVEDFLRENPPEPFSMILHEFRGHLGLRARVSICPGCTCTMLAADREWAPERASTR